jgi:hypothetical protein
MLLHMAVEKDIIGRQARAAAKDNLHDLTYSYLLFKLIDIGADRLGLALNIEIIEEGIKDINEKINAQLAPKHGRFMRIVRTDPKLELETLHKSARDFRDNMTQLYTSFDVLKKTEELLPTLTAKDKPGKRYKDISPDAIETLIAWFKTAASRELDDSEVTTIMKFLEETLMTPVEKKTQAEIEKGNLSVLPESDEAPAVAPLDKTFSAASKNAGLVSVSSSETYRNRIEEDRARLYGQAPPVRQVVSDDTAVEENRRRPGADRFAGGGALWPPKYYRGLSTRRKGQRRREITRRAKMSHKNPAAYRPFATDRKTKRRPSSYSSRFHTKYPGVTGLPAIARATGVPLSVLEKVYDRGLAAWRTGHRPGASQHAWGMARVHSFVLHGKTWRTADADLARRNSS